jgi:hypothetical protein
VSYIRFPPLVGHIYVPTASTRAALAGLGLYTPCRRRGLILQSSAEWIVKQFGPAALPGRRAHAVPLSEVGDWDQIEGLLHDKLGAFDALAVHTRRLPHRPGAAMVLLLQGDPVAFVKIGTDSGIEHEHRVLSQLDRPGSSPAFEAPAPLGFHTIGETRVAVMTVLLNGRHRPIARPPLAAVVDGVQRALRHLVRPSGLPPHWLPMHGDLSPWNLRTDSAGRSVLFDWEEAGFGPPGADEVYYTATSAAVGLPRRVVAGATGEPVAFWQARFEKQGASRLRQAVLRELSRLDAR